MITITIFLVAFAVASGSLTEPEEQWNRFKAIHQKAFATPIEERSRYIIFLNNLKKIEHHNKNFETGLESYKLGITQFADLLDLEFLKLLSYNSVKQSMVRNVSFEIANHTDVPTAINWLELGAVTPVKNQGGCGSCWSFSATGALEGQNFRKTNQLIPLSQQNVIDCSSEYGDKGCQGGLMDYAFQYVSDFGIMSEKDYPYEEANGYCKYDSAKRVLKVQSLVDIESKNESQLEAAVGTIGPISVAVDASYWSLYSGGIFNDVYCGTDVYSLNHGVLVVGYGTNEDGIDYWLVKNSWGPAWGENGYIRLAKNGKNQCGVATEASYPVL